MPKTAEEGLVAQFELDAPDDDGDDVSRSLQVPGEDAALTMLAGLGEAEEKSEKPKNYGEFIKFGFYTVFFMLAYEALMLPQVGHMTFMLFGGYSPQVIACGNTSFVGMPQRDVCAALPALTASTGCEPVVEAQFTSISHERGLYCGGTKAVKRIVSVQMIGVFLGAPVFGQLSDLFGRRLVILVSLVVIFVMDFFVVRATDLFSFTLLQTINMFFVGGMNTVMHVYLVENVPTRHRVWIMMLLSFSPNIIIFAGIAYLSQEWRTLLSVSCYLCIPAFLFLLLCYESPRWMIEKGHVEKAARVMRRIERYNRTNTPQRERQLEEIIERAVQVSKEKQKKRKYYMWHLFYTPQMTKWSLTIAYGLCCTAIISYAMVFNMEQLSGSLYMNSVYLGVFRVILNLALGASDFVFPKLGRKQIHQGALIYVISMISVVMCMKATGYNHPVLTTMATLSATGLCSQLFVVNNVLTAELFPTAIRNIAASFIGTVARFGGIISPNLFLLESYWIGTPYLVIIVIMSINFVLFQLMVPETKGLPLSDNMPDKAQRFFGKKKTTQKHLIERCDTQVAEMVQD